MTLNFHYVKTQLFQKWDGAVTEQSTDLRISLYVSDTQASSFTVEPTDPLIGNLQVASSGGTDPEITVTLTAGMLSAGYRCHNIDLLSAEQVGRTSAKLAFQSAPSAVFNSVVEVGPKIIIVELRRD